MVAIKEILDLFSGLGGASEAFERCPDWFVTRVDDFPLVQHIPNTICVNLLNDFEVQDFVTNHHLFPKVIWASPPCTDFSTAYNAPKSKKARGEKGYDKWEPDFRLLKITLELIKHYKPTFWIIENVKGAIKDFEPYLGPPTQIIGSQVLWGNFPFIQMPVGYKKNKSDGDSWSTDPLRKNKRAKIPYEISMGLKIAIEEQRTLLEWV